MSEQANVWEAIAAPLNPKQIKTKKQGGTPIRYISREDVIYRLNDVCPGEWEFRTEIVTTPQNGAGMWVVKGILTICGVTREDFGIPANDEHFDPPKAAVSDALKRCASHFGFALELYGDSAEQSKHWIDDPVIRRRFFAYTKSKGMSEENIHEALQVEHLHDFTGDPKKARAMIDHWLASHPETTGAGSDEDQEPPWEE